MNVEIKGVIDPRPVESRTPEVVVPESQVKAKKLDGDVVDIPKGAARITPERVKALLDEGEEKHHFPEPRVFDQNGDGKFDVLDIGINNPLYSITDQLKG